MAYVPHARASQAIDICTQTADVMRQIYCCVWEILNFLWEMKYMLWAVVEVLDYLCSKGGKAVPLALSR